MLKIPNSSSCACSQLLFNCGSDILHESKIQNDDFPLLYAPRNRRQNINPHIYLTIEGDYEQKHSRKDKISTLNSKISVTQIRKSLEASKKLKEMSAKKVNNREEKSNSLLESRGQRRPKEQEENIRKKIMIDQYLKAKGVEYQTPRNTGIAPQVFFKILESNKEQNSHNQSNKQSVFTGRDRAISGFNIPLQQNEGPKNHLKHLGQNLPTLLTINDKNSRNITERSQVIYQ